MLKVVLIGCGIAVAYFAGKAGIWKLKEHTMKAGAGIDASPMSIICKGVLCMEDHIGPWSAPDVALGLAAMAKVTEKEPLDLPGHPVDLASDAEFLFKAQHWRALAEAVYCADPATFSLFSHLPESAIVAAKWNPEQDTLRPAYAVAVDHSFGALVLSVRGTSHVIDLLVNAGALPVPYEDGHAHGGFARASDALLNEAGPHIEQAFEQDDHLQKLVIVGHSMGAAIGIMCGLKLRKKYPNLECWGYSVPASLTLKMAKSCASFATCFVGLHDVVPRFSIASIEDLRKRVCNFDWKKAEEIAKDDEDWQKISKAVDAMQRFQRAQDSLGANVENFQSGICNALSSRKAGGSSCENCDRENCHEEHEEEGSPTKDTPVLHPPGRLLVMCSSPPGCGKAPGQRSGVAEQRNYGAVPTYEEAKNVKWVMHEAVQEDFTQIILSPWSVSDHVLVNLCEGISFFQRQCAPVH